MSLVEFGSVECLDLPHGKSSSYSYFFKFIYLIFFNFFILSCFGQNECPIIPTFFIGYDINIEV